MSDNMAYGQELSMSEIDSVCGGDLSNGVMPGPNGGCIPDPWPPTVPPFQMPWDTEPTVW